MTQPDRAQATSSALPSIQQLLDQPPIEASRAERHLWLVQVLQWVRQGDAVTGMQFVARHLEDTPEARAKVVALLATCVHDLYFSSLLSDHGFSSRAALWHDFHERLRDRILPRTPDTEDLDVLFDLMFDFRTDRAWIEALDTATLERLGALLREAWAVAAPEGLGWREPFMLAMSILAGQIRATGVTTDLRMRMGDGDEAVRTFTLLGRATEDLRTLLERHAEQTRNQQALPDGADAGSLRPMPPEVLQQAQYLRVLIDNCARQVREVHTHLEAFGVSIDLVFQIEQLVLRCERMGQLLDSLISPTPCLDIRRLTVALLDCSEERRGLRSVFSRHYALLSRLVTERNAEVGSHYITRTRAEYFGMLKAAAGGGFVIGFTTFSKFLLATFGLSPFWIGLGNGLSYAISFLIVHLLHWTIATKQPAMTAPAIASQLKSTMEPDDTERFLDEVAHLMRSQVVGIIGNLAVVFPTVLLIQALYWAGNGTHLVSESSAQGTLEKLTLLGPTALYAAFTGVLLFASSIAAGWLENWFVWHRLESAMRWNPRIRATLGVERAERWAVWWRANISGVAANVLLGLMLGMTPVITAFFGLPLEVRHVTLSTGQLAASFGTFGPELVHSSEFWWCVAALPVTAMLNVTVSFALALRVAMLSRGVRVKDRLRLTGAIFRHFLRHPGRFLLPPSRSATTVAQS